MVPIQWVEKYQNEQNALKQKIIQAQKLLPEVQINYDLRVKISQVCSELDVDGLRGDIVTNRAAKAYAAFQGKREVDSEDIFKIIMIFTKQKI